MLYQCGGAAQEGLQRVEGGEIMVEIATDYGEASECRINTRSRQR